MREHVYERHATAASLVKQYGGTKRAQAAKLKGISAQGMWAFVTVPRRRGKPCTIHYWYRADQDPRMVAHMIGHELGHIADGGPKDGRIGGRREEDRADEFGRAAQEAITLLCTELQLIAPEGLPFDPRGPSPAGRVRTLGVAALQEMVRRTQARRAPQR